MKASTLCWLNCVYGLRKTFKETENSKSGETRVSSDIYSLLSLPVRGGFVVSLFSQSFSMSLVSKIFLLKYRKLWGLLQKVLSLVEIALGWGGWIIMPSGKEYPKICVLTTRKRFLLNKHFSSCYLNLVFFVLFLFFRFDF